MTAKDIISTLKTEKGNVPAVTVEADMPVLEVLPRLLDSPLHEVGVAEDGISLGVIDERSLLEGLGNMIASRDDCSVITVECAAQDYSASMIAHAVEDSDAHLVDLFSVPADDGKVRVTLRVRHSDPTAAVRSLERYDFNVVEVHASGSMIQTMQIATERLLSLQALMNV